MSHNILLIPIRSSSTSTKNSVLKSKRCFKFLMKIEIYTTHSYLRRTIRNDLERFRFILQGAPYSQSLKGALEIQMWVEVPPWHHLQEVVLKWSVSNPGCSPWLTSNKNQPGEGKSSHITVKDPEDSTWTHWPKLTSPLWWPPSKPAQLRPIRRKFQTNIKWGKFFQMLNEYWSKVSRSSKTNKQTKNGGTVTHWRKLRSYAWR